VHQGSRYCPLTDTAVIELSQKGLPPAQWEPLVPPSTASTVSPGDAAAAGAAAAADGAQQSLAHSSNKRAAAMATAARLRSVLQRLCCGGGGGRMQGPGRAMGNRQSPMWLYINHLGWCRCVGRLLGWRSLRVFCCAMFNMQFPFQAQVDPCNHNPD
jgi:hypothetical protein